MSNLPILNIKVSDFLDPYDPLNARTQLDITKEQALHAAITVGTPLLRKSTANGRHALAMATYRYAAINASIDFSTTNLSCFDAYGKLDPSEKVNLSYWIGMVFCTLLAKELLGVVQLINAACFTQQSVILTNPMSKSLADLIGRDSNKQWHILEAKGSQIRPSQPKRLEWTKQAKTIRLIGTQAPLTRSYSIALIKQILSAELVDPEGEKGTCDIVFLPSSEDLALLEAYYGPLREVLEQSSFQISRDGLSFILTRIAFDVIEQRHVFIGMESNCYNRILEDKLPGDILPVKGDDFYLGADGIIVLTSAKCDPISN